MSLTRKDAAANGLVVLVVLTYLATRQGWNVWLVGGSHRWAAGTIFVLGMAACALGKLGTGRATKILGFFGMLAFVLAVMALVLGSLTPLSFLVADIVLLWAGAMVRHTVDTSSRPLAT